MTATSPGTTSADDPDMHDLERAQYLADEAWANAPKTPELDCCVAQPDGEHCERSCPRGSACHCARPIGHPVPVEVFRPRDARR
ncbi:MAG TPA: hypothetical protein VN903_15460 [Polyangia bacterium]|nr:hypothetical protein [Polyangia bacterium]